MTAAAPTSTGIEICDVTVTYRRGGGRPFVAVNNVNLAIRPGDFTCLVGPSGCGKSTLLAAIAGLIRPVSGVIRIDDRVVSGATPGLGMVFQRDLLLPWRSVLANVLLPVELMGHRRSAYLERARELLSTVGLSAFEDRLPNELSGGMRQRVAICRALVHSPSLLLMDEPFGQVDALTRERLNEDVSALCHEHGVTTVFVTHSIDEAVFLGDKVVVMATNPGRVSDAVDVRMEQPRRRAALGDTEFFEFVRQTRQALVLAGTSSSA